MTSAHVPLTPHFTLEEFTVSQTAARLGIDNTPPLWYRAHLQAVAEQLEAVRALLGVPVHISSGYRCFALNTAVGGAPKSAHLLGLAADFIAPQFGTPLQIARAIAGSPIRFDQLIYEYGTWVHLGLSEGPPRGETLSIFAGTGYLAGLVETPLRGGGMHI